MSAITAIQNLLAAVFTTFWTPIFFAIFVAILTYALWPRNKAAFDEAARLPLREDDRP